MNINDYIIDQVKDMEKSKKNCLDALQEQVKIICQKHWIDFDCRNGYWSFDITIRNEKTEFYFDSTMTIENLKEDLENNKFDLRENAITKEDKEVYQYEIDKTIKLLAIFDDIKELNDMSLKMAKVLKIEDPLTCLKSYRFEYIL